MFENKAVAMFVLQRTMKYRDFDVADTMTDSGVIIGDGGVKLAWKCAESIALAAAEDEICRRVAQGARARWERRPQTRASLRRSALWLSRTWFRCITNLGSSLCRF